MNAPLPHLSHPVAIEEHAVPPSKPKRGRRWPLAVAGLVVLAGLGLVVNRYTRDPNANLATAPVTVGDIEQTVLATGTLKPVKLVAVGAQASGRLVTLNVTLGQKVRAGDLIAEIDSLTQQNTLRTNEAALRNVRAQRDEKQATLALAEANLARQQTTLAQKASSRADYDNAEATVKQTQAQIAQLEAQIIEAEVAIETARVNLGYTRITAPIDGTVLSIATPQGQTVNAVQSAPTIVVLGQVETMTVRVEISEADVVRVRPGQNIYFTILGDPDRRYTATLGTIEPAPESVKTDSSFSSTTTTSSSSSSTSSSSSSTAIYYNGVFDVANPDGRLMTYMTAEVHILLGEARNVLTIPSSALGNPNADGSYSVRVLDGSGKLEKRSVRVGLNNKIRAEVQSGLREGERVVTSSPDEGPKRTVMPPPPSAGGP
ncbi:efflux RND transporter periplasmic adaptor subunit [Bradyrhizobium sp. SRS-191]|uniref:efflux RND transporter periplasmic adaptor subunit n=1 Tax=Bradyrhizobium sp. SRS-191 TaxID=2962606 RepID=UPI00211EBE47|nr:efflux RND transporter periplasmic adaptor subunit [Bradyrhizobium sp. SRS-191]